MNKKYLTICQCPIHTNFYAICIDGEFGSGIRLTPTKCCGQWKTIKKWKINQDMVQSITDELLNLDFDILENKEK